VWRCLKQSIRKQPTAILVTLKDLQTEELQKNKTKLRHYVQNAVVWALLLFEMFEDSYNATQMMFIVFVWKTRNTYDFNKIWRPRSLMKSILHLTEKEGDVTTPCFLTETLESIMNRFLVSFSCHSIKPSPSCDVYHSEHWKYHQVAYLKFSKGTVNGLLKNSINRKTNKQKTERPFTLV